MSIKWYYIFIIVILLFKSVYDILKSVNDFKKSKNVIEKIRSIFIICFTITILVLIGYLFWIMRNL